MMHWLRSNSIYYSSLSKATVVEFWPSFRWEVTYLLACLTVNYHHPSSSYGQAPAGLASGVSPFLPSSTVQNMCFQVLSQQGTALLFIDCVEWLLGQFFSTDKVFVDQRSVCTSHLGRCVAHVKPCAACAHEDLPPLPTSCSYFIGCSISVLRGIADSSLTISGLLATLQMLLLIRQTMRTTCRDITRGNIATGTTVVERCSPHASWDQNQFCPLFGAV